MKTGNNYVFGKLGDVMLHISQRTQFEAGMLSMTFMMMGLAVMTIYLCFFTEFALVLKILTALNAIAGLIFMGSYLTMTFQQYKSYMAVMEIQNEINKTN